MVLNYEIYECFVYTKNKYCNIKQIYIIYKKNISFILLQARLQGVSENRI